MLSPSLNKDFTYLLTYLLRQTYKTVKSGSNHVATVNSEIFVRILFSRKALKRHICDVKNSQLRHHLPL